MNYSQMVGKYLDMVYFIVNERVDSQDDVDRLCADVFSRYAEETPSFDMEEDEQDWFVKAALEAVLAEEPGEDDEEIDDEDISDALDGDWYNVKAPDSLRSAVLEASPEEDTVDGEESDEDDTSDDDESDDDEEESEDGKSKGSEPLPLGWKIALLVAFVAFLFTVTPLRSCASNGSAQIHDWAASTFHIGMKKSSKGIKMEIVDARAENEFLYLTVKETFRKKDIVPSEEEGRYILPSVMYKGSLLSSKGETVEFDNTSFLYESYVNSDYGNCSYHFKDNSVSIDDDWFQKNNSFTVDVKYKVYIPDLKQYMEEGNKYVCLLQSYSTTTKSYFDFRIPLEDIEGAVEPKTFFLNHWVDVDELTMIFQQVEFADKHMDIIVEWQPYNDIDIIPDAGASLSVYRSDDKDNAIAMTAFTGDDGNEFPPCVKIGETCYMILTADDIPSDFDKGELKMDIQDIYCDYSVMNQKENKLKDVTLKGKKLTDKSYQVNTTLNLGELKLSLTGLNVLKPEEHYIDGFIDYTYSYLGFDGSLEYTGEGDLAKWMGYMDLVNPETNETARFCIEYYNVPESYAKIYHFSNELRIESYHMASYSKFLKNLSQWHVASVTEVYRVMADGDELADMESYQNKWINAKYADVSFHAFRGQKQMVYADYEEE